MTPTVTEAQAIDQARAALERAERIAWPDGARTVIARAAADLRDAIDIHGLLLADRISWEQFDTGLAGYAEPHATAVEKSAEAAADYAGHLAEVIAKHIGPGAAEHVSNRGES